MGAYGEPIVIPCRVKYCNLVKPDEGGQYSRGNFNVMCLIPKDDEQTMMNILGACAEVAGVGDWKELRKHPFMNQTKHFKDGDDQNANKQLKDKDQLGHYFTTIGTDKHFDTFVLENGDYVECDRAEIYDGCYAAVLVTPYEWKDGEVTLLLNAVTKIRDGQRIGRRVDPLQAMRNWASPGGAAAQEAEVEEEAAPAAKTSGPSFGAGTAQAVKGQLAQQQEQIAQQSRQAQPSFGGGAVVADGGDVGTRPRRGRPAKAAVEADPAVQAARPAVNGRSSLNDLMSK